MRGIGIAVQPSDKGIHCLDYEGKGTMHTTDTKPKRGGIRPLGLVALGLILGSAMPGLALAGTVSLAWDAVPDVTVNSYSSISCTQVQASITLAAAARVNSAPALPRTVAVVNQGGPRGKKSGAFTVLFNERRADIDVSGRVMGRDLLYWRNAFGSVTGNPAYDIDSDLNGDGVVDGADLTLLAVWHGTKFF